MDKSTRHPTFLHPLATIRRVREKCGDAKGETAASIETDGHGVRKNGAGGRPPKRVESKFSAFLSAGSTILRVTTTGNHPSPTTATSGLLTEIHDVCSVPGTLSHPRSLLKTDVGIGIRAPAGLHLGGQERIHRWR